jgi:hypothetical protein
VQIHNDAEILGQYTGLTLGLAFGGVDYDKQRHHLEQGVDILIGTPGRLIDFYKQRVFDLARSRSWCSTKPIACSTSVSSPTSATSCVACPRRTSA